MIEDETGKEFEMKVERRDMEERVSKMSNRTATARCPATEASRIMDASRVMDASRIMASRRTMTSRRTMAVFRTIAVIVRRKTCVGIVMASRTLYGL